MTITNDQYYPDRAAQQEVNAIVVVCRYKQLDCPWEGQLRHYKVRDKMVLLIPYYIFSMTACFSPTA